MNKTIRDVLIFAAGFVGGAYFMHRMLLKKYQEYADHQIEDVRDLLNAAVQLRDGKPLSDLKMNWIKKFALGKAAEKVQDTDLGPSAAGV